MELKTKLSIIFGVCFTALLVFLFIFLSGIVDRQQEDLDTEFVIPQTNVVIDTVREVKVVSTFSGNRVTYQRSGTPERYEVWYDVFTNQTHSKGYVIILRLIYTSNDVQKSYKLVSDYNQYIDRDIRFVDDTDMKYSVTKQKFFTWHFRTCEAMIMEKLNIVSEPQVYKNGKIMRNR